MEEIGKYYGKSNLDRYIYCTFAQITFFYEDKYTLNLIEKSKVVMKKFNGEVFNYEPDVNIEINSQLLGNYILSFKYLSC